MRLDKNRSTGKDTGVSEGPGVPGVGVEERKVSDGGR